MTLKTITKKKPAPKKKPQPKVHTSPGDTSKQVLTALQKYITPQSVARISFDCVLSVDQTRGALRRLFNQDKVVKSGYAPNIMWQLTPTDNQMEKMISEQVDPLDLKPTNNMITPPSEPSVDHKASNEGENERTIIHEDLAGGVEVDEEVKISELHAQNTESGFVS